jgi:hypothetical protein
LFVRYAPNSDHSTAEFVCPLNAVGQARPVDVFRQAKVWIGSIAHFAVQKRCQTGKRAIVALVERGGDVRSFHVAVATQGAVEDIIRRNVSREARLHTDESRLYHNATDHVVSHESVKHSAGEYARGHVHTNTIEGYFSIFKRGMRGNYQHCAEKNLHRYLAEFEFRYNTRNITDSERAALAVKSGEGKRLTFRQPN